MSTIQVQFIKNSLGTRTIDVDTISVGGPGSITFPSNTTTFLNGNNVFTNLLTAVFRSELAGTAGFRFKDTSQASNAKAWSWETSSSKARLVAYDDAYSVNNPAIEVTRVAAVPVLMSLMNAAGTRIVCGNMADDGATMFQIGGSLYVQGAITHVGAAAFSGVVTIADGSAAAPALAFISDTNTGLYRIGTKQIGMTVNGAQIASWGLNGAIELNNQLAAVNVFAESGDVNQKARKIFRITDAALHAANAVTGIILENRVGGSNAAGDAAADYGIVISNWKSSYLISSILGNIHGGLFLCRNGTGDAIPLITDAQVIAGYSAGRTSKTQQVNSAGTILKDVQTSTAIIDTVNALFTGQRLTAARGALGNAIAIDNVISLGGWTNLFQATLDNVINFRIDAAGKHTFWPAASAVNAFNMLNNAGVFMLRANNDATELLKLTQGGRFIVGAAADDATNLFQVNGGDLSLVTVGRGLRVKEGANGKQGTAVLVAGTLVVANTSITANSRIFLTSNLDGGTPGFLRVSARSVGVSFTILSSNAADTSTVAWEIFEPGV